ncbi:hypothetical protein M0R72_13120 [Candidatus Pacearchaeota archaeon]|jgi:hypothetical protein|nr:hypothetical protein [Candidatus Pacearchaeota archaeon]
MGTVTITLRDGKERNMRLTQLGRERYRQQTGQSIVTGSHRLAELGGRITEKKSQNAGTFDASIPENADLWDEYMSLLSKISWACLIWEDRNLTLDDMMAIVDFDNEAALCTAYIKCTQSADPLPESPTTT